LARYSQLLNEIVNFKEPSPALSLDSAEQSFAHRQFADVGPRKATRAPATAAVPGDRVDLVHFRVSARSAVHPGDAFLVRLWAHLQRQQAKVLEQIRAGAPQGEVQLDSQGPIRVARSTELIAHLEIEDVIVTASVGVILWVGEIGTLTFPVRVPAGSANGDRQGCIRLSVAGCTLCQLHFVITVGPTASEERDLLAKERRFRQAFASYANPDRVEVL
jgi:hypothetical protein